MKRAVATILLIVFVMGLCACGKAEASWQEHYDLGVRYLSEGKYSEAIIEFSAAIEVDPQRPEAYVCRAGAHIASGESEENIEAAKQDYETAVQLGTTDADAYVALSEIYVEQGEEEMAVEILQTGEAVTETDSDTANFLRELWLALMAAQQEQKPTDDEADDTVQPEDNTPVQQPEDEQHENLPDEPDEPVEPVEPDEPVDDQQPEPSDEPDEPIEEGEGWTERYDYDDGSYTIYEYDAHGRIIREESYNADGSFDYSERSEYNSDGLRVYYENITSDYTGTQVYTGSGWREEYNWVSGEKEITEYDLDWKLLTYAYYNADGSLDYSERNEYNADGQGIYYEYISSEYTYTEVYTGNGWREETSWADGSREIIEYDTDWNLLSQIYYNPDGSVYSREINEYSADGTRISHEYTNEDGYRYTEVNTGNGWREETRWGDGTVSIDTYDADYNLIESICYNPDGSVYSREINEYSSDGTRISHEYTNEDGYRYTEVYTGNGWREETHWDDGSWEVYEYDADWNQISAIGYNSDGSIAWSE